MHNKQYEFVGLWTLSTKPSRPDIWGQGEFTLFNNGNMKFERAVTPLHIHWFSKVCRYLGVHLRIEETRLAQALRDFDKAIVMFNTQWERDEALELPPTEMHYPKAGGF